jgi:hypothetical protein
MSWKSWGGPVTLQQTVEKCEYRKYAALLETETQYRVQ